MQPTSDVIGRETPGSIWLMLRIKVPAGGCRAEWISENERRAMRTASAILL